MQYTQDYDENMLPIRAVDPCTTNCGYFAWSSASIIQPYLKSRQVLMCPSNTISNSGADGLGVSYTYNWSAGGFPNRSLASIIAPAQVVTFADGIGFPTATTAPVVRYDSGSASWYGYTMVEAGTFAQTSFYGLVDNGIHLEGANYAFADGHVKWQRFATGGVTYNTAMGAAGVTGPTPRPDFYTAADKRGPARLGVIYRAAVSTDPGTASVYN